MTAISELHHQHINSTTLQELLSAEGLTYEALGAGPKQALECLEDARDFYSLPQVLQPFLDRYALHLRLALNVLEEAKAALQ